MKEGLDVQGLGALLPRVRSGDRAALRQLVAQFGGSIYANALSLTGDPAKARQIAKDTLQDILKTPGEDSGDEAYARWVAHLIARNTPADLRREEDGRSAASAARRAAAQYEKPVPPVEEKAVPRHLPPRTVRTVPVPPFDEIWETMEKAVMPEPSAVADAPAAEEKEQSLHNLWYAGAEPPMTQDEVADEMFRQAQKRRGGRKGTRKRRTTFGSTLLSIVLVLLIVFLVWWIVGTLCDMGILPPLPFGYQWFNENVYPIF